MKKKDMKHALAVKTTLRRKAPRFTRQDAHKKKRLGWTWRKAKGLQSKVRLRLKHHKRVVKTGYGTPVLVKNSTVKGVFPVRVYNENEVSKLKQGQGAIIAAGTSIKTKMAIIDACAKAGLPVMNINQEKFRTAFEKFVQDKKEKKEKTSAEHSEKKPKQAKHEKEDGSAQHTNAHPEGNHHESAKVENEAKETKNHKGE